MFILLVLISTVAASYDSFEVSEEKVSEICSYLADDCQKCVQYKSCLWCPSDQFADGGTCMANYNSLSRYNCMSRNVYSYKTKQCPSMEFIPDVQSKTTNQLHLLVKLLKLLKYLHQLRYNSSKISVTANQTTKQTVNQTAVFTAPILNKTNIQRKVNSTIHSNSTFSNTTKSTSFKIHKYSNNKTLDSLKPSFRNSTSHPTVNTTKMTTLYTSSTHKDCQTEDITLCLEIPGCIWQENKCSVQKQSLNRVSFLEHPHCVSKRTCGSCTESSSCYWCDRSKTCHSFTSANLIPPQCKDSWYHDECSYKKSVFLIIIPTISIIIFLSIAYVCIKNCYYHQLRPVEVKLEEQPILFKEKNGKTVYQMTESEDEEDDRKIIAEKSDLFW